MCGWSGDPASEWFVGNSPDGPRTDNSEQLPSGKYVYTKQKKFSAEKRLTSPVFSRTGPDCKFEMAYFVTSDQPDHPTQPRIAVSGSEATHISLAYFLCLSVILFHCSHNQVYIKMANSEVMIGEFFGETDIWTKASVKLPPCDKTKNFQIILETYAPSIDRLFAFDSFRFQSCHPPKVTTSH